MARRKAKIEKPISLRSRTIKQNKCPISKITYYGNCANYDCPYNLVRMTKGSRTGCFHEHYSPTLSDLGKLLQANRTQMKRLYQDSMTKLERSVNFYQMLMALREEIHYNYYCKHCGSPLKAGDECLNKIKCGKRVEIVNKSLEFGILKYEGLDATKRDVWLIPEKYNYEQFMSEFGVSFSKRVWNYLPPIVLEKYPQLKESDNEQLLA